MQTDPAFSHNRMDRLLGDAYRILPFSALELPYQLSVAHYMAVDGEAWADILPVWRVRLTPAEVRAELTRWMPEFVAQVGQSLFGVALLESQAVRDAVMQDAELSRDFQCWDDYHAWYNTGSVPDHPTTDRWPVILSDHNDETLQDGWHRLHCYLRRQDETIPVVFYPRERHLQRMLHLEEVVA